MEALAQRSPDQNVHRLDEPYRRALIGTYAALFPNRMVYVLLVFFPVKLKARTLALLLVGLDVAAAVFIQSQVADAAHLSGCLAGYLYGRRLRSLGIAGDPGGA